MRRSQVAGSYLPFIGQLERHGHSYRRASARWNSRGTQRRVDSREQRDDHRNARDPGDLLRPHFRRQPRDDVHVRVEELEAEQPLEEVRHVAGVVAEDRPQQHAEAHAKPGDDAALDQEDGHDAPGRGAERAQNRNIGALVRDHHGEHGDQVERRHRHDEHQDDGHHGLFDADGAEIARVIEGPVAHLDTGRKPPRQFRRVLRRAQRLDEVHVQ